jgi:predicted transcriptional regulator
MSKKQPPKPTKGELEIMQVLWERGPSTVRQVFRTLSKQKKTTYNTVLKLMQIMTDKRLVNRDTSERPQVYEAAVTAEQAERRLVQDVLSRVCGGSASRLVLHALTAKRPSAEDFAEVKRIIRQLEKGKRGERSP